MYREKTKRFLDIFFSAAGLSALLPLLIVVYAVLAAANGGSPIFLQRRPGRNGKIFSLIKFKTMNDRRGEDGRLLPDSERIHKVGRLVRTLSLDELPQMINVLKGDMSFIGPRPLLPGYLPHYTPQQAKRHNVRPGITGWAQVNGRNAISWQQKFDYDVWYVDNVSLGLDIKIVFMTIRRIVAREGINADANTTMVPFDEYCLSGNNRQAPCGTAHKKPFAGQHDGNNQGI